MVTTQNSNTQSLAQLLAGPGVTISNYTRVCDVNGTGTFTNSGTNLGLSQGIVLASGRVTNIPQAASNFASTQFSNSNDAQLSTLTSGTIYDKCVLEFDIVPQGNYLKFNYVFASEEYPEFVCSQFNDVFGFFISGTNPGGGNYNNFNIATIPNTTLPVCINSVNPGNSGTYNGTTWNSNNCQALNQTSYYVNNQNPVNPNIVYDGMTVKLTANVLVVPCQTYHLKLAIADVADRIYDSGVFLEAYSFTSTAVTLSASSQLNYAGYTSTYEGCVGGSFAVNLSAPQADTVAVNLQITGNATNGTDYNTIPTTILVPPGQTVVTIPVNPIEDNITEGLENVTIAVLNPCTGLPVSSATLPISDMMPAGLTVSDSTLCFAQSAQFTATGGISYNWSPATGLSNAAIANPIATPTVTTTYHVTATWGACPRMAEQTVYVSHPVLSLSATPNDTICSSGNIQINSATSGGVNPVNYLWSTGATGAGITANATGVYTLTLTDGYSCTATASQNLVVSNPVITATATNVLCSGAANGSVTTLVSGTNGAVNYLWNDGANTGNRINVAAGIYQVTVMDAMGCSASASATVAAAAAPVTVTATATHVACFGNANGSIVTNVSGGLLPYTYNWGSGITTPGRSNLGPGTYAVTVTDINGCSATTSTAITQPTAALNVTLTPTAINCFGTNTGSITSTVSGGTATYTYNWGSGITTPNRTNLSAGTYNLTVTDANGCTAGASTTVTQPVAALTVSTTVNNVSCFNGNNGTITTSVNGGTAPYGYNWGGSITTPNRTNLAAGTYNVTVTDNKGCTAAATGVVAQPAGALNVTLTPVAVGCFGNNSGSITSNVSGGTAGYTYNWGSGITTPNRTNLSAGTYSLTVTDINSCTAAASTAITQPTAALSLTLTPSAINCFGGNTGSITSTVSGGTATYTYNWGSGITTPNRTNLSAGTYNLTVTDANGCTAGASANVTQPVAALAVSTTVNNVSCFSGNNGSITTSVNGGTAPYGYSWGGSVTTPNRTNLAAGTYNVTVTDSKGCTAMSTGVVTQPASALNVTLTPVAVGCFGNNTGSITSTVSGGTAAYTYNWGSGITTPNRVNLSAGTYSLTVTDINSCTAAASTAITQPTAALNVTLTPSAINCFGTNTGSITSTVTGGTATYTYNWGSGITAPNRTNLSAGTYNLTVTDANGCTAGASANVTQPAAALAVSTTINNVSCFSGNNGSITTSISGGTAPYGYSWGVSITTPNRTNLAAGTYNVTVTDSKSCTAVATGVVAQPAGALILNTSVTPVSCFGGNNGSVATTVSGGTAPYGYNWGGNITTPSRINLAAGIYHVTVTDVNGCNTSTQVTVTQPTVLSLTTASTPITCNGSANGTITTTVAGGTPGYTYYWNNGSTSADRQNLAPGQYRITVTDSKGCNKAAVVNITQPTVLSASVTKTNVSCNGGANGTINVAVAGGTLPYTYLWADSFTALNRANLSAGNYSLTVTDGRGCTRAVSAVIAQPSPVNIAATVTSVKCFGTAGGKIILAASGGTGPYTYSWADSIHTANRINLYAGTYTLTVTDARGCTATRSYNIGQPEPLTVSTSTTPVLCNGDNNGSITSTVEGGTLPYTYIWTGGGTGAVKNNLGAGTYSLTVRDSNNCSVTISNVITQPAALSITKTVTNILCNGNSTGAIDINAAGGTAPYTYNWNTNQVSQNVNTLPAGTYTVTVTDSNNCTAASSTTISQPAALTLTETHIDVLCNGNHTASVNLAVSGGAIPYHYQWSHGAETQDINQLVAGVYRVTATDNNSCSSTLSVAIAEPAPLVVSETHNNPTCYGGNNGSISLFINGGTPPYQHHWNNSDTAQQAVNLQAGNYTVHVTDNNNCPATVTVAITSPQPIAINKNIENVACNSDSTGAIGLTVSGGTAPYGYLWSNGASGPGAFNLSAGNYSVTVNDAWNCTAAATYAIAQPAAVLTLSSNVTNVKCNGQSNGTITLQSAGGTAPYNYNWAHNGNLHSPIASLLAAGYYSVSVTDSKGCSATGNYTVTQPDSLLVAETHNNVLCFGGHTGNIDVTVTGGNNPYAYHWQNGIATQDLSNIANGYYRLTVTDSKGCNSAITIPVTQPARLAVTETHLNAGCYGAASGSVIGTVNGGTQPYQYLWSNGTTQPGNMQLNAGTYTLTVTDANACTAAISANITQPAALQAGNTVSAVTCYGGSNGSINATVIGGTAPYGYLWNYGAQTQDAQQLQAGTYTLTVTDRNNCSVTTAATVTQPALLAAAETHSNVLCHGAANGAVDVSVSGGTLPYTYNWSNNAQTQDINNLAAATYQLQIRDAHQCPAVITVAITEPAALSVAESHHDVACNGGNNGDINVAVSGGTAPYGYLWGSGVITPNLANLNAGNYTLVVTDANNCSMQQTIAINQPAPLTVSESHVNVLCHGGNNGSVQLVTAGGTAPYGYLWGNSGTGAAVANLAAGVYAVTVTDGHLCTATASATISQPALINISETHADVNCYGGSNGNILTAVNGGVAPYGYLWSTGAVNNAVGNLTAASYSLTVTDANQCTATATVAIQQPAELQLAETHQNLVCNAGTRGNIHLSVTGGSTPYSYVWNNGASTQTLQALLPGQYQVTVTDAHNCTAQAQVSILATSPIAANAVPAHITCNGLSNGSITVDIAGGAAPYSYHWNNGATQASLNTLPAGSYAVTVTDLNQCSATAATTISQPPALAVVGNPANVTCHGSANGSINLTVNGGTVTYHYDWNDVNGNYNPQNRMNLTPGSYSVVVYDANNCTATRQFNIAEPAPLNVSLIPHNPTCYGDPSGYILSVPSGGTNPYHFNWNDSDTLQNRTALLAGNYALTVSDAKNCLVSAASTLQAPDPLEITENHVAPSCYGGSNGAINITTHGGVMPYHYTWSDQALTEDRALLAAGTYTLTVTDARGCRDALQVYINQPQPLSLSANIGNVRCHGDSTAYIQIAAAGGSVPYAFLWNNSDTNTTLNNIAAGSYSITVTDANGCNHHADYTVLQPLLPLQTGINALHNSCFEQQNGAIDMNTMGGTGPYSYNWSNGAHTEDLNNLAEGFYEVTITDNNGCTVENAAPVASLPPLVFNAAIDNPACQAGYGNIQINGLAGTAPFTFHWSNGDSTAIAQQLHIGAYAITITDGNGCSYAAQYQVEMQNTAFDVDAGEPQTIMLGETAQLNAHSNSPDSVSYIWTPANYLSCTACPNPLSHALVSTTYYLTGTDSHGCTAQDQVTIDVTAWGEVFTPNAFSPNGDGNNDFFEMFGSKGIWKEMEIMIFNRWGEKVFESTDMNFKWDGTYKGQLLPPAVYVYVLNVVYIDGRRENTHKGSITLVR